MNLSPGSLAVMLLESGLGFIYFNFGRKNNRIAFIVFGIALMLNGYFFDSLWALILTSILLALGPFLVK